MPVMDGPAMIHALRRIDPKVRVIAASGLSPESHMSRAPTDTVKAFLPKPYTPAALVLKVREVLNQPRDPKPDPAQTTFGFTQQR